ncbi:response regulator transcription factor [Actinomadura sp. ATCC 39365]
MRIVIAVMLREGLCMLLTSRDHEVAAAVGDGDALLAAVAEHGPDIAVVDVRMPPSHTDEGLRAAIRIRRDHPSVGVLVFSQYIEKTVLDPEVVTQIMGASRRTETLGTLTPREREVLAMMAEGRSNNAIAAALFLSYGSVEKHVTQIFTKLGLSPSDNDHRRVLAVLHYLQA